jgi:hypothetical protein
VRFSNCPHGAIPQLYTGRFRVEGSHDRGAASSTRIGEEPGVAAGLPNWKGFSSREPGNDESQGMMMMGQGMTGNQGMMSKGMMSLGIMSQGKMRAREL